MVYSSMPNWVCFLPGFESHIGQFFSDNHLLLVDCLIHVSVCKIVLQSILGRCAQKFVLFALKVSKKCLNKLQWRVYALLDRPNDFRS